MRVCVDVQSAVTQSGGVSRYTESLTQHLIKAAGDDDLSPFCFDFKRKGSPFPSDNCKTIRWCPGRAAQLAWKTLHWPPFNWIAGAADVYHFPNFIIPPLSTGKSVVTIHDVSFLRTPEHTEQKNLDYLSREIRNTTTRADAIITVSRFSAQETQELLDVDESKIFPIHLGISDSFHPVDDESVKSTLAPIGIDRPYILAVGTIEPRKNLPFLIEVFEALKDFDGTLVLAGGLGWKYEPILEKINNSPRRSDIKHLTSVDDQTLRALYSGAEMLIQPSFYEGFGLPPLEAMACGTPAISSSGGSLPEVLESAAVVLDSFECDAWTDAIMKVLQDSQLKKDLVSKGLKQAAKYTWDQTARKTWDVYRSI
jgi:glycosyltransferase involved in cell wall biosynthesis